MSFLFERTRTCVNKLYSYNVNKDVIALVQLCFNQECDDVVFRNENIPKVDRLHRNHDYHIKARKYEV